MNPILPKRTLILAFGLLLLGLLSSPLRADILYASNIGRSQIGKFTAGGAASVFVGSVSGSTALAFDSAGNLYAAITGDNTIAKFTPGGVRSVFASSGISVPKGLAFDSAGNLYVANEATNTIVRFTPGGVGSAFANSGLNAPRGLAFDSVGNLYVANSGDNSIVRFTPGGVRSVFANSRLNGPVSLAFDRVGNLYASNRGDDTITKFTPGGAGTLFASGGPNGVFGLAFDSAGNLYASNSNNHTIVRFTPGGVGSIFTSDTSFPDGLAFTDDTGVPLALPPRAPGSAVTLTGFTGGIGSGALYPGQSFSIPGSGSFTNISFNFLIGDYLPVASGTAYLLSAAYGGTANGLSNATPGYVGSATASGGFYHFGNTVTLVGGRQYFLYTDTSFTLTGSSSDDYPGGSFYGGANFSNFVTPNTFVDGNFAVNGAPVASLPRADILYVSALSNRNQIVKVAGTSAVTGFADGDLLIPAGVAFDGAGNLYVADNGLDRIAKVTPGGARSIFASSVGSPHGLAFDVAGNLYVSNFAFDTITKITPAGVRSVFASSGLRRPSGLAFDGAGNLYVANYQGATVTKLTPAGVGSVFATNVGSPYGLAFDGAGNLYIANTGGNGSIVKITPAGVHSIFVDSGLGTHLFGLAFDSAGILHVANLQDGLIKRFSPTGVSLGVLGTVPGAQYIAFTDSAGVPLTLLPPGVPAQAPEPGRIVNMSIRSSAGTGAQTLIVGAIIGGTGTIGAKPLLVRGIGPALTGFGVPGALADPTLSVFAGAAVVATNDNWNGDATVNSIGTSVGAFQLAPVTSRDAALYTPALAARDYTIQITGVGGTTGVALAELYDATAGAFSATTPQLINVSARTQVGTGADILIAGFTLGGTTSRTVLIRAVGPTLGAFGVPGVLADPQLALYSGPAKLEENNDWGAAANAALISATTTALSTFALAAGSRDSVILTTLPPGSYTAQVSGVAATTGIALVEIYLVP